MAAIQIFLSAASAEFETYRDALQESPDVVMRHADVVKLLAAPSAF